jgi:ArsR family transcriptional regulator
MERRVKYNHDEELAAAAEVFKTLSDPTRLRIISALSDGETNVTALCEALNMSQPAVSHQLARLRDAHLVRSRRAGRVIYYELEDEHVMTLVSSARAHAAERR